MSDEVEYLKKVIVANNTQDNLQRQFKDLQVKS